MHSGRDLITNFGGLPREPSCLVDAISPISLVSSHIGVHATYLTVTSDTHRLLLFYFLVDLSYLLP